MGIALLILVAIGSAAFVDYRLWWSVRNQTIQIKGLTFKRSEQPTPFWVYLASNIVAALILTGFAGFLLFALFFVQ